MTPRGPHLRDGEKLAETLRNRNNRKIDGNNAIRPTGAPHPAARRRLRHDGAGLRTAGGGLPRPAVRRLAGAAQGLQRPACADPPGRGARNPRKKYLQAGADIIETDSFNANAVSLADYRLEECAYEISKAAAGIARSAADAFTARNPQKPRFVAGSVGPTNRTASMSADVQNPAAREVTFAQLVAAYTDQVRGLMDGGADILLVETVFDTLNAKAGPLGHRHALRAAGPRDPRDGLRNARRRQRPHPLGADRRGFRRLGVAREPAVGRTELRLRGQAAAALPRTAGGCGRNAHLGAPERRPSQRDGRLRRDARNVRRRRRGSICGADW